LAGYSPVFSQTEASVSNETFSAPSAPVAPTVTPTGTTTVPATVPTVKHTTTYTVVAGDSLTKIAQKFNTTRKKLRALNNLASYKVKPGQVLLVPAWHSSKTATASTKAKVHHTYLVAQPVQDFDVPASTFASCPVPLPSPDDDADSPAPASDEAQTAAPVAKLVSPAEMAAEPATEDTAPVVPKPRATPTGPVPNGMAGSMKYASKVESGYPASSSESQLTLNPPPAPRSPLGRTLAQFFGFGAQNQTPATDWGNRFLQEARLLGDKGIEYDEEWRPPGESRSWEMDCSNTTRYLYKVTAGIELPRTASDQYYYLHLQGKAWDVPQNAYGLADTNYLRQNLKPGDLLFWENTYRPERQPPITHVMVYLGVNDKGQWLMAGSQSSRGGEHNRANGGPDVYVFRPSQPCGGYTTWLGLVHHRGRFCAFGRPLEADPTKLSVAESN